MEPTEPPLATSLYIAYKLAASVLTNVRRSKKHRSKQRCTPSEFHRHCLLSTAPHHHTTTITASSSRASFRWKMCTKICRICPNTRAKICLIHT